MLAFYFQISTFKFLLSVQAQLAPGACADLGRGRTDSVPGDCE